MRSIPLAMTWELLKQGRWLIPLGILGANFIPILLVALLRFDGLIDPTEPAWVTLQMMLTLVGSFTFGGIFLSTHHGWPWHYTLPVRTSTLVTWRMFPVMLLTTLQSLLGTSFVNGLFGLDWPLWGPALFAAVFVVAIQSALWFSDESVLLPVCLGVAGGIPGLWYKSRYGAIFSTPTHMWREVTLGDAATLTFFAAASYVVANIGVARNRCGERPGASGLLARIEFLMKNPPDFMGIHVNRFQTHLHAQLWYEWRTRGWLMPTVVAFVLLPGLTMWVLFGRDPKDLMEGIVGGGALLSGIGIMGGIVLGNRGSNDKDMQITQFLGTRPITNAELSSTILKVAAQAVLTAWVMWVATFAAVLALLLASGSSLDALYSMRLPWWYLPATLVGCWIVVGLTMSVTLAGRIWMLAQIFITVIAIAIASIVLSKLVGHETQVWLSYAGLVALGIVSSGGSLWTMIAAKRRSLVTARVVAILGSVWGLLSIVGVCECLRHPTAPIPAAIFLTGLASLTVAPLAAAPLALTWNRHR